MKVLDFGLVKALDDQQQAGLHATGIAHRHAALHVARGDPNAQLGRCPQRPVRRRRRRLLPAHRPAGVRRGKRRRPVPEARRHAAHAALRAHAHADPGRARSRAPGLPGKIAREASANGPRPGHPHRALPRSAASGRSKTPTPGGAATNAAKPPQLISPTRATPPPTATTSPSTTTDDTGCEIGWHAPGFGGNALSSKGVALDRVARKLIVNVWWRQYHSDSRPVTSDSNLRNCVYVGCVGQRPSRRQMLGRCPRHPLRNKDICSACSMSRATAAGMRFAIPNDRRKNLVHSQTFG